MDQSSTSQTTPESCAYCKRTDVPLRRADYVDKTACDACAQIIERAMAARVSQDMLPVGNNPAPIREVPAAWEKSAQQAGERAAMAVRYKYEAEQRAYEHERANNKPAYWLASHPCPPWCTNDALHRSSDMPDDRMHDSDMHAVSLHTMEPGTVFAEFAAPEVTMLLVQRFREVEPRVFINDSGDDARLYATLDEAEKIAFALLDLVRQARGGWKPTVLPFDHQGRCGDDSCIACKPAVSA